MPRSSALLVAVSFLSMLVLVIAARSTPCPHFQIAHEAGNHIGGQSFRDCTGYCPEMLNLPLEKVWKAYRRLEKPVLIHCSAGIGRTGKAASYIKRKLKVKEPRKDSASKKA